MASFPRFTLTAGGRRFHPSGCFGLSCPRELAKILIKNDAPPDFNFHATRHTIATWLKKEKHSMWDIGVVLNHSEGNSVTAGYSHGHPTALKLELLEEWAGHIASLIR
jgi:integrase